MSTADLESLGVNVDVAALIGPHIERLRGAAPFSVPCYVRGQFGNIEVERDRMTFTADRNADVASDEQALAYARQWVAWHDSLQSISLAGRAFESMRNAYAADIRVAVDKVERLSEHQRSVIIRGYEDLFAQLRKSAAVFTERKLADVRQWAQHTSPDGVTLRTRGVEHASSGAWDEAAVTWLMSQKSPKSKAQAERLKRDAASGSPWSQWVCDDAPAPIVYRIWSAFEDELRAKVDPQQTVMVCSGLYQVFVDAASEADARSHGAQIRLPQTRGYFVIGEEEAEANEARVVLHSEDMVSAVLANLRTPAAMKGFRWLAYEPMLQLELTRSAQITFASWTEFAKQVRLADPYREWKELRDAMHSFARLGLHYRALHENRVVTCSTSALCLLTEEYLDDDVRNARITITPGDAMLRGFIHRMAPGSRDRTANEHRQLVPVLHDFPAVIGRADDTVPQMLAASRVVIEMRQRAKDLVLHGGVNMPWDDIFTRSRVRSKVDKVLQGWIKNAFLKAVSGNGDRWTLGDNYRGERAAIERSAGHAATKRTNAARRTRKP